MFGTRYSGKISPRCSSSFNVVEAPSPTITHDRSGAVLDLYSCNIFNVEHAKTFLYAPQHTSYKILENISKYFEGRQVALSFDLL